MKHILITGGAGFIGANFVVYFANKYPDYHLVNLDKLTYAGDLSNLVEVEKASNYTFVQGDICDRALVESLFEKYHFQGVIHFAASKAVGESVEKPLLYYENNIASLPTYTVPLPSWM